MANARRDLEAQYAKALSIGKTPEGFNLIKQAALGQNDDFDQIVANMALRVLTQEKVAFDGLKATQQLADKPSVAEKNVARADMAQTAGQLPELLGIGQLPAPNMEALAAADGGIVGYAGGGEVERYQAGGLPEGYEWFEDPTSGEVYQRKKRAGLYDYGLSLQEKAQGIKPPPPAAPITTKAPAAPTAAPAAGAGAGITSSSKVGKAVVAAENLSKPVTPVENPTEAEKSRIDQYIDDMKKLQTALRGDKADEFAPIKEQLAADRKNLETMKSENVGLALLGAAGAMLKPGRSTASAIGEGLSSLAESGTKFQPQLAAVRQGLMGSDLQLAQAQAAADKGDMATAAALIGQARQADLAEKELGIKAPLFAAQARYYGARAADTGGAGGIDLKGIKAQQGIIQAELKTLQGKVDPASQARAKLLTQQLSQLNQALSSRTGINLATGFVPASGGQVFRSSLFEE